MQFALVGKLRADKETVYNKAMEKWYRRLAEVPGIDYKPDPAIDRTKLPMALSEIDNRLEKNVQRRLVLQERIVRFNDLHLCHWATSS